MIKALITSLILAAPADLRVEKEFVDHYCPWRTEVVLEDRTRVDCLGAEGAYEFDFDDKWAEALGQALWYGLATGRRPGIVLIMRGTQADKNYQRLRTMVRGLRLDVDLVRVPYRAP